MKSNTQLQLARRVDDLTESAIFAIKARADELAGQGHDIIHLDAGEPDFDTPTWIIDAAKQALDEGVTYYTPVGGLLGAERSFDLKYSTSRFALRQAPWDTRQLASL
jgi:aspartate aminotransferase